MTEGELVGLEAQAIMFSNFSEEPVTQKSGVNTGNSVDRVPRPERGIALAQDHM